MTEMESSLEDYADGLGFHFDSYFIWRLLYRWVGDALSGLLQIGQYDSRGVDSFGLRLNFFWCLQDAKLVLESSLSGI